MSEASRGGEATLLPGERSARKRRARREQVLETAARMFYERGYEVTTTQDIGAEMGLLKGSIYYYISSKEDLLYEIIEQYHDGTRDYFERILNSDLGPVDKLRELVVTETAHTAKHVTRSSLFYTEWRSLSAERQAVIVAERARHEHAVIEWITAAQRVGDIRSDVDPKLAAFGIFGMVNSVYRWFRADGRKSAEEVGEEFCGLVVDGLLDGRT